MSQGKIAVVVTVHHTGKYVITFKLALWKFVCYVVIFPINVW